MGKQHVESLKKKYGSSIALKGKMYNAHFPRKWLS